jgi:hypothetical protein
MIGVAGVVLILVAIGVLVWAAMATRKQRDQREAELAAAAAERSAPPEQPAATPPLGATGNLPVDTGYDEEEMPTVVVARPPGGRPAMPQPGAGGTATARTPAPRPRSSGATIIAFDDEDDDDSQA